MKLTEHAQIGGTIFSPGIDWKTVIERAQREYRYQNTPAREAARLEKFRRSFSVLQHRERSNMDSLMKLAQPFIELVAAEYGNDAKSRRKKREALRELIKRARSILAEKPRRSVDPVWGRPFPVRTRPVRRQK